MLKAWLRELPDELFPKEAQDRIARECSGSEKVPQLLIDELSSLSPFNYYLLFAITCHLSLLLAHSDKNKMDFRNLCICFQPCMKIDAFCFKFLVCDWRDCWKGCRTEARYIEEEYKLFDQPPPQDWVLRRDWRLDPKANLPAGRPPPPSEMIESALYPRQTATASDHYTVETRQGLRRSHPHHKRTEGRMGPRRRCQERFTPSWRFKGLPERPTTGAHPPQTAAT